MLLAQATTQDLGSSSGLLMFLLGGGLIGLVISAYKFVVNFRTTERGMARQRVQQANKDRSAAQWEGSLWQQRSADLEYIIRTKIGPDAIPALSEDLRKAIAASGETPPTAQWETAPDTGGRPGS